LSDKPKLNYILKDVEIKNIRFNLEEEEMDIDISKRAATKCWCGNALSEKVAERRHDDIVMDVVRCTKCDTLRIENPLAEEELEKYYKSTVRTRLERGFFSSGVDTYRRLVPRMEEAGVRFSKGKTVLEVGCNLGYFLHVVRPKVKRVMGVEPLEEYREYCLKLGIEPYPSVNVVPKKSDIVVAQYLLEHLTDPLDMLKKIKSKMKKNGRFIVRVPDNPTVEHVVENRHDNPIFAHIFFYTPETLGALLCKAGFKMLTFVQDVKPDTLHWVAKIAS